ncbi:hypothetical protein EDB83DRAFT_2552045 [Lactarius deliciosus]|nr:hypothetical protein EDB83DRAFT_2552045 [Lactarius deliciosus]
MQETKDLMKTEHTGYDAVFLDRLRRLGEAALNLGATKDTQFATNVDPVSGRALARSTRTKSHLSALIRKRNGSYQPVSGPAAPGPPQSHSPLSLVPTVRQYSPYRLGCAALT